MRTLKRRPTLAQLVAGLVATVAGYASFRHIFHVARMAGEPWTVAAAYPLATDGLIVVATGALFEHGRNKRGRVSAWVGLVVGVAATLAYNVLSTRPDLVELSAARAGVAAWPAVAFLLSIEILTHGPRKQLPDDGEGFRVPPVDDEHQAADPLDDELRQVLDELPAATGRGAVTARVQHIVTARPELTADPVRVHQLVGGSRRQIRRVLSTLAKEPTA